MMNDTKLRLWSVLRQKSTHLERKLYYVSSLLFFDAYCRYLHYAKSFRKYSHLGRSGVLTYTMYM